MITKIQLQVQAKATAEYTQQVRVWPTDGFGWVWKLKGWLFFFYRGWRRARERGWGALKY
jgi:hypothetical protein